MSTAFQGACAVDQADHRLRRIVGIEIFQQGNNLAAAMPTLDSRCHVPVVHIQCG
jgi:hypothetical protein